MLDKMFSMLILLLNRKRLKASEIAARLDISIRTVYRFVDKLSLSGVPIITKQGYNGGLMLGEEFVIDRNYFTSQELNIIEQAILSLNLGKTGMDIVSKLNAIDKNATEINIGRVISHNSDEGQRIISAKIQAINDCLDNNYLLNIHYHSRHGTVTTRDIQPLNFVIKNGEWYIYCYCMMRKDYRTFKLTRISHLNITTIILEPLKDYPKLWHFEDDNPIELQLFVRKSGRYLIEDWLGVESIPKGVADDCNIVVNVNYSIDLVYKLLSFGDNIKIIAPLNIVEEYNHVIKRIKSLY